MANKIAKLAGSIKPGEPAAPASLGLAAGPAVLESVQEFAKQNGSSGSEKEKKTGLDESLKGRLKQLIDSNTVMLFMKGSPDEPKCGFSRKVVEVLKRENVEFGSFDIFSDEEVREGLKKYSNWPTFPQLYCKGELLGGCDIVIAMHESGELKDVFKDHGVKISRETGAESEAGGVSVPTGLSATLTSRLASLIESSPVMVFMKGSPEEPKCGFSNKVVEILRQEKVDFGSFDILYDE